MKRNTIRNNSGMTLVELMVAVALFIGLMVVSIAVFGRSVDHQETTTVSKNLQEGLQYALSYMATEAAGAREELGGCGGATDAERFFFTDNTQLYFRDRDNVCVRYATFFDEETGLSRLQVGKGESGETETGYLTPSDLNLQSLHFTVNGSGEDPVHRLLTISISGGAASEEVSETITLETSVAVAAEPFLCGETLTDRDGYEYETAAIGDQCWMAQSLRTKTKPDATCIRGGSQPCDDASAADDGLGRSCYDNDEENCEERGALYTWSAAMDGSLTPGDQGICPSGWHIPKDVEWFVLEHGFADSTCNPDRTGLDCTDSGTELKEGGSSDFSGVLSGSRDPDGSTFSNWGNEAHYWSSSIGAFTINFRSLDQGSDGVNRDAADENNSYSVRCIKD